MISHDCGVIFVNIPHCGGDLFEDFYIKKSDDTIISSSDVKKLPGGVPLVGKSLGKTIRQFHDYDLFAIVKSPYLRAHEMWIEGQTKLRKSSIRKQSIGEYYENLLNGWECADDDAISCQASYLKSTDESYFGETNVDFEVKNLFHYENLMENNLTEINEFLTYSGMHPLQFYVDYSYNDVWREHFDQHSIEMINYIFDEDFEYCGYIKI